MSLRRQVVGGLRRGLKKQGCYKLPNPLRPQPIHCVRSTESEAHAQNPRPSGLQLMLVLNPILYVLFGLLI